VSLRWCWRRSFSRARLNVGGRSPHATGASSRIGSRSCGLHAGIRCLAGGHPPPAAGKPAAAQFLLQAQPTTPPWPAAHRWPARAACSALARAQGRQPARELAGRALRRLRSPRRPSQGFGNRPRIREIEHVTPWQGSCLASLLAKLASTLGGGNAPPPASPTVAPHPGRRRARPQALRSLLAPGAKAAERPSSIE